MNKQERDELRALCDARYNTPIEGVVGAYLVSTSDTFRLADSVPALLDEIECLQKLIGELLFSCVCTFNEYGDCSHCGAKGERDGHGFKLQQHNDGCAYVAARQAVEDMEATNDES